MDERLIISLAEQCSALLVSGRSYDQGHCWEAKRIANSLAMLVHDTKRSKSILSQLGVLNELEFVSYSRGVHKYFMPNLPLVFMEIPPQNHPGHPTYKPLCNLPGAYDAYRHISPFVDWWGEAIFMSDQGELVSRGQLVWAMRCMDGGAHVDPDLDRDILYKTISTVANAGVICTQPDGSLGPVPNPHFATVRQIGSEFIESLRMHPSKLPPGFVGRVI